MLSGQLLLILQDPAQIIAPSEACFHPHSYYLLWLSSLWVHTWTVNVPHVFCLQPWLQIQELIFCISSAWYRTWHMEGEKVLSKCLLTVFLKTVFSILVFGVLIKNLLAMQKTLVWSLGWEDPLENGMATHSSILAWRIAWTEEPGGLESLGSQRVGHDWATNTNTHTLGLRGYFNSQIATVTCFNT